MADKAPQILERGLSAWIPANPTSQAIFDKTPRGKRVRAKLTMPRNLARQGWYWVMLGIVADNMPGEPGDWTDEDCHDWAKEKLGLGKEVDAPGGGKRFKPDSTAFDSMDEYEFTEWVEKVVRFYSRVLDVPVEQIMEETRNAA